jgi:hypothetical protein
MSRPDEPIHVSRYVHASDAELHAAFEEVRGRVADLAPDSTRAVIADIELEAIRRGLPLPSVAEPMPAELAFHRCLASVQLGYDSRINEWLSHVDLGNLWRIWFASRPHDEATRILIMRPLKYHVENRVWGAETAAFRRAGRVAAPLNREEEVTYLDQCTGALFDFAFSYNCMPW